MRRRERERSSVGRAKTRHLMARGGHPALSRSVSALAYHFLPPNIGGSPNNSDQGGAFTVAKCLTMVTQLCYQIDWKAG